MPLYYRHAAGHCKAEQDSELEDKLHELQQQTLTMHNQWEEQQAATQACKLSALYTEAHRWTLPHAQYSTRLHNLFSNLLCIVTTSRSSHLHISSGTALSPVASSPWLSVDNHHQITEL